MTANKSYVNILQEQQECAISILHVDDDIEFAEMATSFLEHKDDQFETKAVGSATEGLDCLTDSKFDCIISDYEMPKQNGIEFLKSVREDYPNLPFILYTGRGSEDVASDAFSAGADEYIQKESGTDHFDVVANRVKTLVERRRAEHQRQQLADVIETAREGIAILDSDGYHTQVNQSYADMYSMHPDAVVGKHWTELHPEEQVEYVRDEILPTAESTGYWHGRTTGLRADGTTFTQDCVLATTTAGMTIRTVRDISEQIESQEQLSRYEALIEVLNEPVYVIDKNGEFEFVNDAFISEFGYDRCEILGSEISLIKDKKAVEQGLDNLRRVLSSDEPDSVYFETEIQSKSGESIPCEDHMTALPYEDNEFNGSVGILRNISEQKEREQELERQNRRLNELVGVVSHDLRNPLNVAKGNLALLSEEYDNEQIDAIERSLTRMSELIDDFLRLSRVGDDTDSWESVSLASVPRKCWQSVETGDATLEAKTSRTIQADPSRLAQLFENLMRNAVEHTSQDVTVTIGELEDGFYVEDDGSGIPKDSRDSVLEAGYTTTDDGTGFGLSIVQEVVEAHGWDIYVTEGTEGGARFEVTNVSFDTA